MKYKFVDKYMKKSSNKKSFIYSFFIKMFVCILIVLIGLITLKGNQELKHDVKDIIENKFSVSRINNFYKRHFGDILPFESLTKSKSALVFDQKINYKKIKKYKNGVKIYTEKNFLVPNIKEGIVIFVGNKKGIGKTVIVEQTDGTLTLYGKLKNTSVNVYDYIEKKELIGEADNYFYLCFKKDGKYLDYKEYIK